MLVGSISVDAQNLVRVTMGESSRFLYLMLKIFEGVYVFLSPANIS